MTGDAIGRIARRKALQDAIKACRENWDYDTPTTTSHIRAIAHCVRSIQALMDKPNEA